jgi:hypothetical protein
MRQLDRLGWELSEDDDGGPLTVGTTAGGREVLALYGRDAITSAPSLAEIGASFAALQAAEACCRRSATGGPTTPSDNRHAAI